MNSDGSHSIDKADSSELKRQLARLKKEYLKKTKALQKNERHEKRRSHVKQRVQEEAAKRADDEAFPTKKPSRVTFERQTPDDNTTGQKDKSCTLLSDIDISVSKRAIYPKVLPTSLSPESSVEAPSKLAKLFQAPLSSQLDFSDSIERKIGKRKRRTKRKDDFQFSCEKNISRGAEIKPDYFGDLGIENTSEVEGQLGDEKTLFCAETNICNSNKDSFIDLADADSDPLNNAVANLETDTQFQLVDGSEDTASSVEDTCLSVNNDNAVLTVHTNCNENDQQSSKKKKGIVLSPITINTSTSSNDTDDICLPTAARTFDKPKTKRKSGSELDNLDFSFLDDECHDLYSQVKQRRRQRARSLPGNVGTKVAKSSPSPPVQHGSESTQDTMEMSLSPSVLKKGKGQKIKKSGRTDGDDVIVIDCESQMLYDSNHSKNSLQSPGLSSNSRALSLKLNSKYKRSRTQKRHSISGDITVSSSVSSNQGDSQESVASVMNQLLVNVEQTAKVLKEFDLPEADFGQLIKTHSKERASFTMQTTVGESSVRNETELKPMSPTSVFLSVGRNSTSTSPQLASIISTSSSQADFQSQGSKRGRRRSRGRGRRSHGEGKRRGRDLGQGSQASVESSVTEGSVPDSLASQDDPVSEDPACPIKLSATVKYTGHVVCLHCREIPWGGGTRPVVLTCTSSTMSVWAEEGSDWLTIHSCSSQEGEHFLTADIVSSSKSCAVVVVSVTAVSYLFQVSPLDGAAKPCLLDEIPVLLKNSRSPPFICPLPSAFIITRPYPTVRNHTDLTLYPLPHQNDRGKGSPHTASAQHLAAEESAGALHLTPAPARLVSVVAVDGCAGIVVGIAKKAVFIWSVHSGRLLKEVASQFSLLHCAKTVTENGLLFVPVLVDSVGGGGLLAVNPAAATTVLLNPLEVASLANRRKSRWQHMSSEGDLLCVTSKNSVAVFSTYWGQLVACLNTGPSLEAAALGRRVLAVAAKGALQVYTLASVGEN